MFIKAGKNTLINLDNVALVECIYEGHYEFTFIDGSAMAISVEGSEIDRIL